MPILHLPGEMMPGQFGPISACRCGSPRYSLTFTMSATGMPSVMQTTSGMPASAASIIASAANARRHINHRRICAGFAHRIGDRVENRNAFVRRAAFAGRDAADDVRAVVTHLQHVKRAFFAGDSLNDQTCIFID